MEIIVPAAGLSTRFPNMRPKYSLTGYDGYSMLYKALEPYLGKHNITVVLLAEHVNKLNTIDYIKEDLADLVNFVVLDQPTKGPAETIYQAIKKTGMDFSQPLFIKDCDSFFDHDIKYGNYVCVTDVSEHNLLKNLSSKSFVTYNSSDIIIDIIEKNVVSDKFCVGGYKFDTIESFCSSYEAIANKIDQPFVSHVIQNNLSNDEVFTLENVSNYVDVGTKEEWFEYNDKPVIFCDIDGTIIKAGPIFDPVIPLENNIAKLKQMQSKGAQLIFTTARKNEYFDHTFHMLEKLGFSNFTLIVGLQNTKRILINDFNAATPYPRAVGINLNRNQDNLELYL